MNFTPELKQEFPSQVQYKRLSNHYNPMFQIIVADFVNTAIYNIYIIYRVIFVFLYLYANSEVPPPTAHPLGYMYGAAREDKFEIQP